MVNGFRIQNIQHSHLQLVAKWQHSEREKHGYVGSLAERELRLREHVRESCSNTFPITYVATLQGNLVGCCSLIRYGASVAKAELDTHLWLSNVYVHPDYRKRGIAEKLISYSQKQASLAGVAELQLFTSSAADYYRGRGWVAAGIARVGREDVQILKYAL